MASKGPSTTAWRTVAAEQQVQVDEGDILKPLSRVADRYAAKAAHLRENAFGDFRNAILEAADANDRAAQNVRRLTEPATFDEAVAQAIGA